MPSTYLSLNAHVIFATRKRTPFFDAEIIGRVHQYLGGSIRGLGAAPLAVGGIEDHVHLLIGFPSTMAIADFVRETKKASTKWMREDMSVKDFRWQEGYAGFTVSQERVGNVKRYIEKQAEHHRNKPFLEEIEELLRFNNLEFRSQDWE